MKVLILSILSILSLFVVGRTNAQCSICENLVGIIESWVEANNTITAIEGKLDMLCSLVPAFEGVCYGIVDFDVKGIVGYLEKNGDATGVCKKMGVCAGLRLPQTKRPLLRKEDTYCAYCEYFFGMLETLVHSGAGEDEVEQYLEVVCSLFPNEAICQFGVRNVAPVLIEYFTMVADPSTVCYDFGVCEFPTDDDWEDSWYDNNGGEEEAEGDYSYYEDDDEDDTDGWYYDESEWKVEKKNRSIL